LKVFTRINWTWCTAAIWGFSCDTWCARADHLELVS
jgi:hypothetical protein